jgi:N-methylhydantoinase B
VVEDVLDGYLTREAAARDFRVAIGADGKLDAAATTKLRAAG